MSRAPGELDGAGLLTWTAGLGAVTAEALALRSGVTPASARARLAAARRRGLLARWRPLDGAPSLFTATRAGIRASHLPDLEPGEVSAANAAHAIACAHAAAALARRYESEWRLVGERELRLLERHGGGPVASVRLPRRDGLEGRLHRPDLVLVRRDGGAPLAVEVELAVKAPARLAAICLAWARASHVRGVVYLASPQARRALERAVAAWARERISLLELSSLEPPRSR